MIIPAARITGELVVRPRGVKEMYRMEEREYKSIISGLMMDVDRLRSENDRLRQELQQSQAREGAYRKAIEYVKSTWSNDTYREVMEIGYGPAQMLDDVLDAGEGGAG